MSLSAANRYPRYRAPSDDGQTLCVPAWDSAPGLVANNRALLQAHGGQLWGHSLRDWAISARSAVLAAATRYTRDYADVQVPPGAEAPMVLTGHQPGLVHPGVWLKNFAAADLARNVDGVALSLVIDSDLCRSTSILVPAGTSIEPRSEHVPFDLGLEQIPWEDRPLVDRSTWEAFGAKTTATIEPLLRDPLIESWWPEVTAQDRGETKLSAALSRARHRLELSWRSQSLEIPQSQVCQTAPFQQFAAAILADAQRFRQVHNEALADYRLAHRLRNHAQPVPDLAHHDGWVEAPFWLWSDVDTIRRAVFVRRSGSQMQVSDRAGFCETLPCLSADEELDGADCMAQWEARGVRLRTRALLTTLFARLFLADVFIHGIGGAKYDQVTDDICERMFGFRPPEHITLSGTLKLPIPHPAVPPNRERQLRRALRELAYHPETSIQGPTDAVERRHWDAAVAQKRSWVATPQTPQNSAERHRHIVGANAILATWTAAERDRLQQEILDIDNRRRASRVLESREYAFCLFPRHVLRGFLLAFSAGMP